MRTPHRFAVMATDSNGGQYNQCMINGQMLRQPQHDGAASPAREIGYAQPMSQFRGYMPQQNHPYQQDMITQQMARPPTNNTAQSSPVRRNVVVRKSPSPDPVSVRKQEENNRQVNDKSRPITDVERYVFAMSQSNPFGRMRSIRPY